MYRIAVLAKTEAQETFYSDQISCFCTKKGLFPRIDHYLNPEWFFEAIWFEENMPSAYSKQTTSNQQS